MAQEKTPGVYIKEANAFPNSVVEVPTAVPAFLGYTQKALRGKTDLTGKPTRISSMHEFEVLFGGPPTWLFTWARDKLGNDTFKPAGQEFLLYLSMQIFFNNGGGTCWIVSVGGYDNETFEAINFDAAWEALAKEQEPSICVVPDAVTLSKVDHAKLNNTMLMHCAKLQSRVTILDLYEGAGGVPLADAIMDFRNSIVEADNLSYGMAYAPWLNTNIVERSEVDFTNLDMKSRKTLANLLVEEVNADKNLTPAQISKAIVVINTLQSADITPEMAQSTNLSLIALSKTFKEIMQGLLARINLLPPSGAMAGIWTRTDDNFGVWKAPANTGVMSVISPNVAISNDEQQDMNVPLDGRAINAIRTFQGRGVLVWGARTLDGNSQDWRYINVRRTLIMLEQSIKLALEAYVFAPNDASTWVTVNAVIDNFLNNQWKAGALAGATPDQAYDVAVGLGSTMTDEDILNGYMCVTVKVAVTHPAEFIIFTFQQKMQTS